MTVNAVIYRAPHLRQLVASDPHGGDNCTAYAMARAVNAATLGGVRVTGAYVRSISNEPIPDPQSPGLSLPQIVAIGKKLHVPITDMSGGTWDDVVRVLDTAGPGRRVIAQIDYPAWQDRCQDRNINFGHALTLDAVRRHDGIMSVLGSDPLCDALRWYRAGNVRDAMVAWGRKTGYGTTGKVRFAVTREIPLIAVET